MRIVLISDLHRGSDNLTDNFGRRQENRLIKLIDACNRSNVEKLIILGDKEELWQGRGRTADGRLRRIYQKYYRLEKAFASIYTRTIPGNHDWYLKYKYNLPPYVMIKENKMKMLFIHGHQFEKLFTNKFLSGVSRVAAEVWGGIESIFGTTITGPILYRMENTANKIKNKVLHPRENNEENNAEINAIEKSKSLGRFTHVFFGHTHRPNMLTGKINCINTGTWIDGNADYVLIDTKASKKIIRRTYNGERSI